MVGLGTAAVVVGGGAPDGTRPGTLAPPDPVRRAVVCDEPAVHCGSVSVPAIGDVEYAVLPGTRPGSGLVLVEPGGPGFDALAIADREALGLPAGLAELDLLLLREPWARYPPPSGCREVAAAFAAAAAGTATEPVLRSRCALATWTAADYVAAVKQVLAQEGRILTGLVGQSFGALPAVAAASAFPSAWLVLNAPIAPPTTSGSVLVSQRAEAVRAALARSYRRVCRPSGLDCTQSGPDVVAAAAARTDLVTVPGRSQVIVAGDVALAALAASYGLRANEQWLWSTLSRWPGVDDEAKLLLGRMADQLLQRYDEGTIAVDLAAFLAGTCRSYRGWDRSATTRGFLAELARACAGSPAPPAWPAVTASRHLEQVCVFRNEWDPVSPPAWADRWMSFLPQATIVRYRLDGHASLADAVRLSPAETCPVDIS